MQSRVVLGMFRRGLANKGKSSMPKIPLKTPQKPRIGDGVPTYSMEEANKILTPKERAYAESLDARGEVDNTIPPPTNKKT